MNTGPLISPTPVVFEDNDELPCGLEVTDTLATAKGSKSSMQDRLEIGNYPKHDI